MKAILSILLFTYSISLFAFGGDSKINIGAADQMREGTDNLLTGDKLQEVKAKGPSLALNYESLYNDKMSYFFGGEFEISSNVSYFYTGVGMNYFLGQNTFALSETNAFGGYLGLDLGISSIKLGQMNNALSAVSTGLETGVHLGGSYYLAKDWMASTQLGYAYHLGFLDYSTTKHLFKGSLIISRKF